MKAPKYVIAPEGCASYLIAGKMYEVRGFRVNDTNGGSFWITGDNGSGDFFCLLKACPHLKGGDWIIPDDEPQTTKPRVLAIGIGDITVDCDDNPNRICISDGSGDYIVVPRANIPALIEALKMMVAE